MTKEDLFFLMETKKEFEFEYKGKTYSFMHEKKDGHEYIKFGKLYFEEEYSSFNDLYARAEIENSYLREVIEFIKIS